jgi:hypothetical protein
MQYGVYDPSRIRSLLWTTGEGRSTKTAIPYAVWTGPSGFSGGDDEEMLL